MGPRLIDEPHPHAGFETITLLLEGAVDDRDEGGALAAGDVQWMTAGSGVIHGETLRVNGKVRLLQLWLTLPAAERWTAPAFRILRGDAVPVRQETGARVRIYSGASGKIRSTTPNRVALLMLDLEIAPHAVIRADRSKLLQRIRVRRGRDGHGRCQRGITRAGPGRLARSSGRRGRQRARHARGIARRQAAAVRGRASGRPDRLARAIHRRFRGRHPATVRRVSRRKRSSASARWRARSRSPDE